MIKMNLIRKSLKVPIIRRYSSALFIPSDKAQFTYAVLTPHIDFEDRFQNKADFSKNLKWRQLNINIEKLQRRWDFYKMIQEHILILEDTKSEISKKIAALKEKPGNENEIEKLILHAKIIKDDLKNVKDYFCGIEENAILTALSLPNVLHQKTPESEEEIVYNYLEKPSSPSPSHLEISNDIIFHNSYFYYLKSTCAQFELALTNYFVSNLRNFGYTQFSNADFTRSVIVEGCGRNFLDNSTIILHETEINELSRLHLIGGSSLYSFMSYFCKNQISPSYFPLKIFSSGRTYKPQINTVHNNNSLFGVVQQSQVNSFLANLDKNSDFERIMEEIIKLYEPLNYHFRLVYIPANKLENCESLRLSIQMFSNFLQNYVQVGHVSLYDDYLSKRLLFVSTANSKERIYPNVIFTNFLNVGNFLACALENNYSLNKPLICKLLKECIPS